MTYTITNTTSGADLGAYDGDTPLDAYRAMMADAGYRTQAEAASAGYSLDEIPADVRLSPVVTTAISIYSVGDRVRGVGAFKSAGSGKVVDFDPDRRNAHGRAYVLVALDKGPRVWLDEDDTERDGESIFDALLGE